jgi:RNA polymerase sigma factor (sigma-70 family)
MDGVFERALRGERAAQSKIHQTIRRMAKAICAHRGPKRVDLDWEDVAQEASRRFFTAGIGQYCGRGTEESFLFGIVRTTVLQISRGATRRRQREADPGALGANVSHPAEHRLDARWILSRLDEECAQLLERVYLHDMPYAVLAAELGLREGAIRVRVSRCLRKAMEIAGSVPR